MRAPPEFQIGDRRISENDPCFVIAEVGVNHNGDMALAERLIDSAAEAGADAVKFQTFRTDALVVPSAAKAQYQELQTGAGKQADMLRGLELTSSQFRQLRDRCRERGVEFMSTAFDAESLREVLLLEVRVLKWPSGEINNLALLQQAANSKLPLILSTGMADLHEVEAAVDVVAAAQGGPVAILQCVSQYPAPLADQNLRCIQTLAARFECVTGFSDHTDGIVAPLAARGLGMAILEKHITLDRRMEGPDHAASLEPAQFAQMVRSLREVEAALGDGVKRPAPSEHSTRLAARKSLVYACDMAAGQRIASGNLTAKRPGTGLSPTREAELTGRRLARPVAMNQLASLDDFL